jgi:hypothetical protein
MKTEPACERACFEGALFSEEPSCRCAAPDRMKTESGSGRLEGAPAAGRNRIVFGAIEPVEGRVSAWFSQVVESQGLVS